MIKRVTGVLFEGDLGSDVEVAVKAQNVAVEFARFEYDGVRLGSTSIEGHPGCKFTLTTGIRQFEAMVDFGQGAPARARYDLFQINDVGTLVPVGEGVDNDPTKTPIIGFGIDGVLPPVRARRAGRPRRPTRGRRAAVKKAAKRAVKKAKTTGTRKTMRATAKRVTKKVSRRRTSKPKRTASRARKRR